jgi:hypothetical protein
MRQEIGQGYVNASKDGQVNEIDSPHGNDAGSILLKPRHREQEHPGLSVALHAKQEMKYMIGNQ